MRLWQSNTVTFRDRLHAGNLLAEKLSSFRTPNTLVIGLARGGVVVAKEIAKKLSVPLDVLVVKKISDPHNPELAIGAMAPDNVSVVDWRMAHMIGADEDYVRKQTLILQEEIRQKTLAYRKGKKPLVVREKTVILVDDGVATGATLEAAIKWLRSKKTRTIIVAVPVAPPQVVAKVKPETKHFIVIQTPTDLAAVGQFYERFGQVEDGEVIQLLR